MFNSFMSRVKSVEEMASSAEINVISEQFHQGTLCVCVFVTSETLHLEKWAK